MQCKPESANENKGANRTIVAQAKPINVNQFDSMQTFFRSRKKNGFVAGTKLGTTNIFFVAATEILLQHPNVLS